MRMAFWYGANRLAIAFLLRFFYGDFAGAETIGILIMGVDAAQFDIGKRYISFKYI